MKERTYVCTVVFPYTSCPENFKEEFAISESHEQSQKAFTGRATHISLLIRAISYCNTYLQKNFHKFIKC